MPCLSKTIVAVLAAFLISSVHASRCPRYKVLVLRKTADHPAGLNYIVDKYNRILGGEDNGNKPGPLPTGRRSINWDAAPLPFDMPFDFFNRVATRGALFSAKKGEFRVSNTGNASNIDDRFDSIIPKPVAAQFQRFSPLRLFTPLKRNFVRVSFRVPATGHKATVRGFGAIFADVDLWRATKMRFYDRYGCPIAHVPVQPRNKGLSFAGIVVLDKRSKRQVSAIATVDITLGNISFKDFARTHYRRRRFADLVCLDDLFYAEPAKSH